VAPSAAAFHEVGFSARRIARARLPGFNARRLESGLLGDFISL
jgi:hypothetical protein